MIRIARTEPLLWTADLTTLKAFYELLGFETKNTWEPDGLLRWCSLEFRGASLMLQQDTNTIVAQAGPNLKRDYGLYFVCDGDIDEYFRTLLKRGVNVSKPKNEFYGMRQIFVRDPDGRNICFEVPVDSASSD